jgi:prevent-host-death family protein
MHEAKTRLSQLVDAAEHGEEVVIARRGKPAVRLVAIVEDEDRPTLASIRGTFAGQIHIAPDFDTLPDDVAEAFGAA